jgi:plastocyanin
MRAWFRTGAVVLLISAAFGLLPGSADAATEKVAVGTYWYGNSSYQSGVYPSTITEGDTVQWNFSGGLAHTVTECGGPCTFSTNPSPLFDSGPMSTGSYSFVFNTPGTYYYQCEVHFNLMRGEITVEPAGVGGVTDLAEPEAAAAQTADARGTGTWRLVALAAAAAAGALAFAGGARFAARRQR